MEAIRHDLMIDWAFKDVLSSMADLLGPTSEFVVIDDLAQLSSWSIFAKLDYGETAG